MVTTIFAGLAVGAIYAIVAIGYNIVFIASRVFNFAQAQFVMIGAFTAYAVSSASDVPLWIALIVCATAGAVIGSLEEVLAIRWLRGHGGHNELVTTLGVATLLSGIALAVWGSEPRQLDYVASDHALGVLGGRVLLTELLTIAAAVILGVGVGLLTKRTMIGLAILATSEDRPAAALRGINAGAIAVGAFAVAGALMALVGPLVAAKTYVVYNLGDLLAVKAFVALAVGGFGSYRGALVGGFGVGLVEVFAARYLGTEWENIVVFLLLLLILLLIPNGLFARRVGRTV
jgi:branched-chain amino acid transport system permease protein